MSRSRTRLRRPVRLAACLIGGLAFLALLGLAVLWLSLDWTEEGSEEYPGGVVLRDRKGEVLRVSLGPGDTDCRPYYSADPEDWIVKALVAVEDGTYWTHCGVRPLSVLRAACQNLFYRRRISGASTLSMQAVRLIRPHPKTFFWKLKEAMLAVKMERKRDKRWILSQYLNRAPFGSNFIGIEAAARGWFGKGAKELGLGEAAMLAGMVQAPSRFRPDRGYDGAFRRRDYVLGRMERTGAISADQRAAARDVKPVVCRSPRPFRAPYFCDWVLAKMGKDRTAQRKSGDFVTALDPDLQARTESAVMRAAEAGGYSVAAVVMKTDTGDVEAMACSGNYFDPDAGQVNTAVAARPAGSTLKPFLVARAFDRGLLTPEERLADVPRAYKGYRPANFDASYRGLVTARDALVLSLNIPFVQLLQRTGVSDFAATLRALGLSHLGDDDSRFGLGMAIGNVEVSLVELVGAYRVIAAGGGDVFSRGASYLVSDILSGEERSAAAYGHVADVALPRFAWKTGTSSAYRDAWTVAWNPEYVIGVWCGHKRGGFGDRTVVGAKAAAPVAMELARGTCPQGNSPWFVEPGEVSRRKVCRLTGLTAGVDCPETEEGRYLVGKSPNRPCEAHVRTADGKVSVRLDPVLAAFLGRVDSARGLEISKPQDGAVFTLVGGMSQQKVVCQASGNPENGRLWWTLDGVPVGESVGAVPFAVEMVVGEHELVCSTAEGVTDSVRFAVRPSQ